MSTKRVRSEKKERQVKRRRVEPLIPSEVTAEVDVLKISALHRGNPEKYTKEVIRRHLNNLWPYQSYRGGKSLWDIVQELGDVAENLQDEYDTEREKYIRKNCTHNKREHECTSDCDNEDSDDSDACQCPNCHEDGYCTAFIDSVNICVYYDLQTDEVIGPLSLINCCLSKKKIKRLNSEDPSTAKAIKDSKQMDLLDANKSVVCIFSK
jgi:hypothetical protein